MNMTRSHKHLWKLRYIREIVRTGVQRFLYRGRIDRSAIRSILVVRLYGIGNMVLATPALRALRDGYPGAKITVLVSDNGAADVVSGGDAVDRLIPFDYARVLTGEFLEQLADARFDLMVVLYPMGVVDLPLVTAAAGIRYRFGFRDTVKGNLYTHPFDLDYQKGEGRSNLDLACRAGGKSGAGPFFAIGQADRERVARFLSGHRIGQGHLLVSMHPGSQEPRRWPKENFAALGDMLSRDYRARIVLVGGPTEEGVCRSVSQLMRSRPIVAAGRTLKETAEIIRRSALFIGNDSGPMHIAAALSTPCIGLFGPTDAVKSRPWGARSKTIVMRSTMRCAPCYRNGQIPCVHDENLCMAGIAVRDVYDRAVTLLAGKTGRKRSSGSAQ